MKKFRQYSVVLGFIMSVTLGSLGLVVRPLEVLAATSPTLGTSGSYSVLAGSAITNTGSTTTTGAVGVSPGTAITGFPPGTAGVGIHSNDANAIAAQADNVVVFGTLDQPCDQTFGAVDLTTIFPAGVGPGVYCSTSSFSLSGNLNLTGSGVWIFKTGSTLITSPGASVTGGDPCNVWWRVGSSATLDTTTSFRGNIFALTSITLNNGVILNGRALAQNGAVTLIGDTISGPTCAVAPPAAQATLHVVKTVINDNGGTALASSTTVHVKNGSADVSGSPQVGAGSPGTSYTLDAGTYTVSEDALPGYTATFSGSCNASGNITLASGDDVTCTITNNDIAPGIVLPASINVVKTVVNDNSRTLTVADFPLFVNGTPVTSGATNVFPAPATYTVTETINSNYTRTFSGDCNSSGNVTLSPGDNKFCIVTNNDIAPAQGGGGTPVVIPPVPPIIDVVKVPSPLALPAGPGLVTYTYTLRNMGTVPVTDLTLVGDTCSPIVLVSGDTDGDARLDVTETWTYTCSTTLTETHTNTVVATGWANSVSATDIANATVVVGIPVVPPLIHVTKVPSPLTLFAGGGMVTYTETITNPGTVPLSNVQLVDDKCSPMQYISGDTNADSMLDTTETWTYTCQTNLTQTTTNTASASGVANGLTARDLAIVTVVVATSAPLLPDTGIAPAASVLVWPVLATGLFAASLLIIVTQKKKHL